MDRHRQSLVRLALLVVTALAVLVPLPSVLAAPATTMEEGVLLVYPERLLEGDVPAKDFEHTYGPASLWTLAAAYELFDVSVAVERIVGHLYRVALALALYAIGVRWHRAVGVAMAAIGWVVSMAYAPGAYAWIGGTAVLLAGFAALQRLRASPDSWHLGLLAGTAMGVAVSFRVDLALAVAISSLPILVHLTARARRRWAGGLALGLLPLAVQLARAGIGTTYRGLVRDPVFRHGPGRRLPVPPAWDHPDDYFSRLAELFGVDSGWVPWSFTTQLFVLFLALFAAVGLAWVVAARHRTSDDAELIGLAALATALLPQALQRADAAHVVLVGIVVFACIPVWSFHLLARRAAPAVAASLAVAVGVLAVSPFHLGQPVLDRYREFDASPRPQSEVVFAGRSLVAASPAMARDMRAALDALDDLRDGGRRLFVGPADLRRSNYNETYFYFLLHEWEPASYFLEMNPGTATDAAERLADEISTSDILLLSSRYDEWEEPNDSRRLGPASANEVVDTEFRLVRSVGPYRIYQRRAGR